MRYVFGPTTPEGFCIHAALAVLDELPLRERDPQIGVATARCHRCDAEIRIERCEE